uniref:Uncharacterized protein n=1 Tax=Myotis lucifugus TaxID=59463 RepID=G1QG61_MYOLU
MSFTVKETVCPRTTRQPPEECDFKENGLVKVCTGTVKLDQDNGYYDFICYELDNINKQHPQKITLPKPRAPPRSRPDKSRKPCSQRQMWTRPGVVSLEGGHWAVESSRPMPSPQPPGWA